ncbi:MAG TPA: aromatic amino acid lyase, partial [Firmicutes bacterium]|nr:aromatic amino acid lyase [Bacillota bacterium]
MLLLTGQGLTIDDVIKVACEREKVQISPEAQATLEVGRQMVQRHLDSGKPAYGVSTGFGALCDTAISPDALHDLQQNL